MKAAPANIWGGMKQQQAKARPSALANFQPPTSRKESRIEGLDGIKVPTRVKARNPDSPIPQEVRLAFSLLVGYHRWAHYKLLN